MVFIKILLLFIILLPGSFAGSINGKKPTGYMGRQIAYTMHSDAADWLTRQGREKEESTAEMIRALQLNQEMVVADLGCGVGYHALQMAPSVKQVLCVDIQDEMLRQLKQRAATNHISNLTLIKGKLDDPKLPANAVDLILLVDAYHEFSEPELMLKKMRASLTDIGVIVLVEFRAEDKSVPIKKDHKMSKQQILKEMTANRFKLTRSYDHLPWQHMMFFEKSPPSPK